NGERLATRSALRSRGRTTPRHARRLSQNPQSPAVIEPCRGDRPPLWNEPRRSRSGLSLDLPFASYDTNPTERDRSSRKISPLTDRMGSSTFLRLTATGRAESPMSEPTATPTLSIAIQPPGDRFRPNASPSEAFWGQIATRMR